MSPIFCQNTCFVQPFYGMWPKLQTLSRERRNMDFHWSMGMSPIFSKNVFFVQPFYGMWPKPQNLSQNLGRKLDWNRSMRMSPIFSQNECFVQPFHDHWPKLQTFSQKGEKWTSIALCERVLYFAKPRALCNHFTTIGLNYRLFRKKAKMEFHWSMRMSPIFSQKVYSAQPFYGMWPKIQTFWQKNVLHSIYLNGVQYSVKLPKLRTFHRHAKKRMICATILRLGALTTDFSQKGDKWALIDPCK